MSELSYPWDKHPAAGTTQEVAPGVRWLTMPMGGSLNHINLYLLEDTHGWWVVDTGFGLPSWLDPRQMMMALGEAIAHLHLLMHRNRIERTLHEDGLYRFRSIDPDLQRRSHLLDHDAPSNEPV